MHNDPTIESAVATCSDDPAFAEATAGKAIEQSRREERSLVFHLLYAMDAFDYEDSLEGIIDNFNRGFDLDIKKDSYVARTTAAIVGGRSQLDELIKPLLENWRFDRISTSTRLILRYAVWELETNPLAPNIIINEAIELAKCFSEKDAYKFINGVLDVAVKSKNPPVAA